MNSMFWLNLGLLVLVTAGCTAWIVGAINRVHGYRVPFPVLHRLRQGHDLVILSLPWVLLWFTGLQGARLLRGGSWRELGSGWQILFAVGCLGSVLLVVRSIRRALRRTPAAQIATRSRIVDVAQRLGYHPTGHGPYEHMLRFPCNEVFQIDVSEKEFRRPRVPDERALRGGQPDGDDAAPAGAQSLEHGAERDTPRDCGLGARTAEQQ